MQPGRVPVLGLVRKTKSHPEAPETRIMTDQAKSFLEGGATTAC